MAGLNPSNLPGSHRTRVFVGGSYAQSQRMLLQTIETAVAGEGFDPIVADAFVLPQPDRDIHDVTLYLLHACKLAVFECSTLSGALMELERLPDYGIRKALLLYQSQHQTPWPVNPQAWYMSQMVKSMALEHHDRMVVRPYFRVSQAMRETRAFLRAVRRSTYGKLHHL